MNYGSEVPSMGAQAASANQLTMMITKLNLFVAPVGGPPVEPFHYAMDTDNLSAARFFIAFPGAVLDKQTGLVWEETPDSTLRTWTDATRYCLDKAVGGTIGWRLPSMEELKSMQDPTIASPFVSKRAFSDAQPTIYWSAKAPIGTSFVHLVDDRLNDDMKPNILPAWCVRGGVNTEQF
jgi:hypothetical protein